MLLSFTAVLAALLPLAVWVGMLAFRGGFWRADQRLRASGYLETSKDARVDWPSVIAVIPARNEVRTVAATVSSLLEQDYPGAFGVILVDDGSKDGTADIARKAAGDSARLSIIRSKPLEKGWTGKLWAVSQGIEHARKMVPDLVYLLLTDADIKHDQASLRRLVAKAEAERLDLVSLMVLLRCRSFWENLLIPAFIFFFQKLHPFPWVNDRNHKAAAAAGGCMLVRRAALEDVGGVEAIRGELIDDCALARLIKKNGLIWLGLTEHVHSLRAYKSLGDVWKMVVRTAFVQLDRSALLLIGTVLAMFVAYLGPPLVAVAGVFLAEPVMLVGGALAWFMMVAAYEPTLELYKKPALHGLLLPLAALLYTLMTVDSAIRHWRGKGGAWKGRNYG